MAKNMARIDESGEVINIEWCVDYEPQTETLIDPGDVPVGVGDTWDGENFFRDGVKLLTPLEEAQKELEQLRNKNAEMQAAYAEGVASA